jgi:hypothetical protein
MKMNKTKLAGAAAIVASGMLVASTASAAPGDLVVTGGTLGFDGTAPVVSVFAPITLNGQPQLTRATIPTFTVIDARGTSAGWTANLAISDLVNPAGATDTIAATNISLSAATVIDSSTGAAAASVTGNAVASFTSGATTPIVTATAAQSSNGTFLISPKILKVVVPSTAIAGTYATTATLTVA